MRITRMQVGTTRGHRDQDCMPADEYVLDTGEGYEAKIWTYGARLVEVLVPDRSGLRRNVIVRLPTLAEYEESPSHSHVGATLGRFARCIRHGRFALDGRTWQLDCNLDGHHFHGGTIGFDRFVWQATTEQDRDRLVLHLDLNSPAGHQGYPGAVSVRTTYELHRDGRLAIEHTGETSECTILAMTNHAHWNPAASESIAGVEMSVNSTRIIPTDHELIPLGDPVDISGTPLDFCEPRAIGETKVDCCYALRDAGWAAELRDPVKGRAVRVITNQPGLAVYTSEGLHPPRSGVCLQTGAWPDSPNQPGFPSPRLDPGMTYRSRTVHLFAVS